ncbi:hypothetical protein DFH29DRAFT_1081754 [Suillus ampliporus]|nr:hypothetical protein DFH29DRAFT_1081754 [Suillus ampliporus]
MNRSNVDPSAESMFSVKTASNSTSIQFGEEVWYASLRASLEYWHEAIVSDGSELIDPFSYLSANFPAEHRSAQLLAQPMFGSAYTAYARYLMVQRVCDALGLDMDSATMATSMGITQKDVILWTGAVEGTFVNHRKVIRMAEELRLCLVRMPSLTSRQGALRRSLDTFATSPSTHTAMYIGDRAPELRWTHAQLNLALSLAN